MTYCFCMPLLDATRCERSSGSNITREKAMKDCSKAFSLSKKSQDVVETNGCKAMVELSDADQKIPGIYHIQYALQESCER